MQKKGNAKTNAATKAVEVKEAVKAVEEKAKEAAQVVEETAKKATTPRRNVKKTAAKAGKVKEPAVSVVTIQYDGKDADVAKVEENIKAKFVAEGHRAGNIKKLEVYIKPQDGKAYYVINDGKFTGDIDLF